MLNELLIPLRDYFGFLNLFEYITFRAGASAILALLISFIFGPFIVRKLINLQIGESIRDHGPDSHKEKQGTPTMGGVLIILYLFNLRYFVIKSLIILNMVHPLSCQNTIPGDSS